MLPCSTKAETEVSATPQPQSRHAGTWLCSTKAETEVSATLVGLSGRAVDSSGAQQRPRPKSRRHDLPPFTCVEESFAQQRPRPKSRRHCRRLCQSVRGPRRSTKAETEVSATQELPLGYPAFCRCSTKAETEVSATRLSRGRSQVFFSVAQQRPRPKSRRHQMGVEMDAHAMPCSTKAETEVSATRFLIPCVHCDAPLLNKGRDRSLGDTTTTISTCWNMAMLNKGRDRSLGDTGWIVWAGG